MIDELSIHPWGSRIWHSDSKLSCCLVEVRRVAFMLLSCKIYCYYWHTYPLKSYLLGGKINKMANEDSEILEHPQVTMWWHRRAFCVLREMSWSCCSREIICCIEHFWVTIELGEKNIYHYLERFPKG